MHDRLKSAIVDDILELSDEELLREVRARGEDPAHIGARMREALPLTKWWLSWYCKQRGNFELSWPWWVSGWRVDDEAETICAAVIAASQEQAQQIIRDAHDDPQIAIEWRFCDEQPADFSPFRERFPRAAWMVWDD